MKYLLTIVFILFFNSSYAQIIIKLELNYNLQEGHSVKMFYVTDSIDPVITQLKKITNVNERNILASFGMPIIEPGYSDLECMKFDTLSLKLDDLFLDRLTETIDVSSTRFNVRVSFLNISASNCQFRLMNKHWASYDVHFREAIVLTSVPIVSPLSKREQKYTYKLRKTLQHILN